MFSIYRDGLCLSNLSISALLDMIFPPGSTVYVGRTDNGTSKWARFKKNVFRILHEMKMFPMLKSNKFDYLINHDDLQTQRHNLFTRGFCCA